MARPLALRSCLPGAPDAAGVWTYMRSAGADDVQRTKLWSNCVRPEYIHAHRCFLRRLVLAQKLSYPDYQHGYFAVTCPICQTPLLDGSCSFGARLLARGAHPALLQPGTDAASLLDCI